MTPENEHSELSINILTHRAIGEFISQYVINNTNFVKTVTPLHPPLFAEIFLPLKSHENRLAGIRFGGPNPDYSSAGKDGYALNIYWKQPNHDNVLYRYRTRDMKIIDAYAMISSWSIFSKNPNIAPHNTLVLFKVFPLTQEPDQYIERNLSNTEHSLITSAQNFQWDDDLARLDAQTHTSANNRYDVEKELQETDTWKEYIITILHDFSQEYIDYGMPEGGFKEFLLKYIRDNTP